MWDWDHCACAVTHQLLLSIMSWKPLQLLPLDMFYGLYCFLPKCSPTMSHMHHHTCMAHASPHHQPTVAQQLLQTCCGSLIT